MNEAMAKVQHLVEVIETISPGERHRSGILPVPRSAAFEPFKVLVADDSPIYRRLVQKVLEQAGYTTLHAKDGREALDAITVHKPSLVISDWEMPDLTGIELCKKIRDHQGSYTYVVLLTSNSEKDHVIEGLAAGADDYLTKPFHSGELLARVGVGRRVVELHHQIQTKNQQLQELALKDSLTGLPNRRAIENWTERELRAAERHKFPFWVVLADLDHFKKVNDTYGHEAGDVVLKRFGDLFRENTRASNICGRLGGEEFVTVLTHVERPGVEIAVERLRHALEKEIFRFDGQVAAITASFGIAGFEEKTPADFDLLMRKADAALYSAKRNGRNRIEFAS
jgi:two-component system, cell cycle response regulator